MSLPKSFIPHLKLWTSPKIWEMKSKFALSPNQMTIWTDASLTGWGALTDSGVTVQGCWKKWEKSIHINQLEIRAVTRALENLEIEDTRVNLKIDNEVARTTINKMGSRSPALLRELESLLKLTLSYKVTISAMRIPSKLNVVADALSRNIPSQTEWSLQKCVFQTIIDWHGPLQIDAMATHLNAQLPTFISPFPHPQSVSSDVLSTNLNQWQQIYLFPPVKFIPKILQKLSEYKHHGVLITPWNPAA